MKMKVSCLTLTKDGDVRSKQFVIDFDDKTLASSDKTMAHANEQARKRFGDDTRVTAVTRW